MSFRLVRSTKLALSVVPIAAAVACGAGGGEGASAVAAVGVAPVDFLDVDDVSILFEFKEETREPFPSITLDGTAAKPVNGMKTPTPVTLWSKEHFDQVLKFGKAEPQSAVFSRRVMADNRANWRIFAMRFDPCAPGINTAVVRDQGPDGPPNLAKCKVELRLIAQPVAPSDEVNMQDFSAHLVFGLGTLDTFDLGPMRAQLAKIKALAAAHGHPTSGVPLGPHPALVARDPEVGAAVHELVNAGAAQAIKQTVAFIGLQAPDEFQTWVFFAGSVMKTGKTASEFVPTTTRAELMKGQWLPLSKILGQSPNLPAGAGSETFAPAKGHDVVHPRPGSLNVSTSVLSFEVGAELGDGDDPDLVAFKVENPTRSHFFNTDCVSCHTSTPRTQQFQTKSDDKERVRVPNGITAYVDGRVQANSNGVWSVRNFGYLRNQPSVSLRAANETAEVVKIMNLGPSAPADATIKAGPGPDCSASDNAVWNCFQELACAPDVAKGNHCPSDRAFPESPAECLKLCK